MKTLNRRPMHLDIDDTEVRWTLKFEARFEDPKMASRIDDLRTTLNAAIESMWNQQLHGPTFGGRRLIIVADVTRVSVTAPRDYDYWLITVRSTDSGPAVYPGCSMPPADPDRPTSITDSTCDGGVMSVPPSHLSKPEVLGHELAHLFGLVDRYSIQRAYIKTEKKWKTIEESTRQTHGRPDPLGAEKTGKILPEDIGFLFEQLGVYQAEESRGLDTLRRLEAGGLDIVRVRAEIDRLKEIIRTGHDPRSLIKFRTDWRDKMLQDLP